jgi:nitrile hydratase
MNHLFRAGDAVRIRDLDPPGHCRVPIYARGRPAIVDRVTGEAVSDEQLAYGFRGPKQPFYWVRIKQCDIWPDYDGNPNDTLELQIFEQWLEKA